MQKRCYSVHQLIAYLLMAFIPIALWAAAPYLLLNTLSQDQDSIQITLKLNDALLPENYGDRLRLIEKGTKVQLTYLVEFYKIRNYWVDELIEIDGDTEDSKSELRITWILQKRLFFKQYDLQLSDNLSNQIQNFTIVSPEDLLNRINTLKTQYFHKKISISIQKSRLKLFENEQYYIRSKVIFEGFQPPIPIPFEKMNFETGWLESKAITISR